MADTSKVLEEGAGKKVEGIIDEGRIAGAGAEVRKSVGGRKKETETRGQGELPGREGEGRGRGSCGEPARSEGVGGADRTAKCCRGEGRMKSAEERGLDSTS